jgi:hypothetical protein
MNLSSAWNVDKILNYANMRELFRVKWVFSINK